MAERATEAQRGGPLPPAFFLVGLLVQIALHWWLPVTRLISAPWGFSGIPLVLGGVAIAIVADGRFKRAATPIHPFESPTVLVTDGVFRFSRNPMYASMVMILLGVAVLFGTLTPFAVIPLFMLLVTRRFIRVEEAALRAAFDERYDAYASRVRRWI